MPMPAFAASELALRFGLELRGEDRQVHGVGTLAMAGPDQLGFLANPRYRSQLADTAAGVVVAKLGTAVCTFDELAAALLEQ